MSWLFGFDGSAIFIFGRKFFRTSNEESQLRKEDEESTARITIPFCMYMDMHSGICICDLVYTC